MTVRIFAETTLAPDGQKALDQYLGVVGPLMDKAGATLIERYHRVETITGTSADYISIIEYPDRSAVAQVFEHPDYLALDQIRAAAFSRYDISIQERLDGPPA